MSEPAAIPRQRRRARRLAWAILRVVVIVYAVWLVAGCAMQNGIIFPADVAGKPQGPPPRDAVVKWIEVDGGKAKVEGWLMMPLARREAAALPATPAGNGDAKPQAFTAAGGVDQAATSHGANAATRPAPLVVILHGNAELIEQQDFVADQYRRRGFAVLLPEYRGYGRSGGSASEKNVVADTLQFYDWAVAQPGVDPRRVLVYGRSIGGGVAVQLAARRPCHALILESTFKSVAAMAWRFGFPPFLVTSPFRSDRILPTLGKPVLLMHGSGDTVIPVSHGRALHALTPGSEYLEFDCDHNDFPAERFKAQYWSAVDAFLARTELAPAGE